MYYHIYRIVGDDDGGKMFTPEEYDEYKKKVVPQVEKLFYLLINIFVPFEVYYALEEIVLLYEMHRHTRVYNVLL